MQEFQRVQNFKCLNISHLEEIVAVCLNVKCQAKNRFLCVKCMISKNHCKHIEDCIQFHFIQKFLENTLNILKSPIQMQFHHSHQNLGLYEQFFSKKAQALINLKSNLDDYFFVKSNIEQIEFAYHILNFQKQFIQGCFQIIEKEFLIYSLEEIYLQNISLYLQEAKSKAYILKSLYKYEEAIRCCDKYLNLQLDSEILCLKGKCLHFLDCLEEAEEIYELAFEVDPEKKYAEIIASNVVMVQMSKKVEYNNIPVPNTIYYKIHNLQSLNMRNTFQIQILVSQLQFQEALVLADQCIAENSENFIAMTFKGYCLACLQNFEKAKEIYLQVKKIYPKYPEAQKLALVLSYQRQDKEIQDQIEQNQDKLDEFSQLQLQMKNFLLSSKFEEAEKLLKNFPDHLKKNSIYKQIESKVSSNSVLYYYLARKHQKFEKDFLNQAAINELTQLFLLGQAKFQAQKYRQALQIFEEGLKIDPKHKNILYYKLQIQLILDQESEFLKTFDLLKTEYPDFSKEVSEQIPYLKIHYQQFHESKIDNFTIQESKAQQFVKKGNYNEAIKIFRSLLSVNPLNVLIQLQEIQCFIFLNQTDYALEELDNLLKYEKNNLQALQLKGYALYKKKQYQLALQIFFEIKSKECNNLFIINLSLGNCYFKLKNYEQAQKIYEECTLKVQEEIPRQGMKARYFKIMYCLDYNDQNFKINLLQEFKELKQNQKKLDIIQNSYFIWVAVALKYFKIELDYIEKFTKQILKNQPNFEIAEVFYAQILFANNKIDSSISVFDKILIRNPENLLALVGIIQLYQIKQIFPQNIDKYLTKALSINKNAFDEAIQKEIFIEKMEQTLERESIMGSFLAETNKQSNEYYESKFSF